jgi:type VI secretion system protein
MTLRLSVVSEHGIRLGTASTKVFGVHGGSIGRGTDNEWILPDPERYLSGKHARVDFRAGTYVLVDTSSNGTYVNGAQVPLGKYHDYLLKDGDYVRLGEYELLVSIDKGNDFPPDESAIVAYDGQSPSSAVRKSTANDLGADLDLSELLEPSDQGSLPDVAARNAYGQAVGLQRNIPTASPFVGSPPAGSAPPARAPARAPTFQDEPFPEDDSSGTPWHMLTRPLKVESKPAAPATQSSNSQPAGATGSAAARAAASPALFDGDFDAGLTAFCRGAGLDPRTISPEARANALHLAGQLLRESVLGVMDLNANRNEFRNRFRISPPVEDGPDSPLSFSRGVDEALVRLLTTVSIRAGSVEAIRHNFRELKAQNVASMTAMQNAFSEFVDRLDPKELEDRFERAAKRGVFGTQNKGKYWDLYAEMYPGLAQRPVDGFPHLFTEAFAKAYEAKVRTLVPPRRSAFGADRNDPVEPDFKAVGDQ